MNKLKFFVLNIFILTKANHFERSTYQQVKELILNLREPSCTGTIFIFDDMYWFEHRECVDDLIKSYPTPATLLHGNNSVFQSLTTNQLPEALCNNVVIFQHNLDDLLSLYRQVEKQNFIKSAIIITQNPTKANEILNTIQNENVLLVIEHSKYLEARIKKTDNRIRRKILNPKSTIERDDPLVHKSHNLLGGHLRVATLPHYPPAIILKNVSDNELLIDGIEPSLINVLSHSLNFTYDYIQAAPLEMWGRVYREGRNLTATGVMGMLMRNEADMAIADMYIDYSRLSYITFSMPYKVGYECFLVPASRPYAKWTALYHPFTSTVWFAIAVSFILATFILYLVSKKFFPSSIKDRSFENFQSCALYVLGIMVGVQQPQEIRSMANRFFLICWFIAATIIPTGYRSGLISYMTFPFTPPAINSIEQLVHSPIQKIIYGDLIKNILIQSTSQEQKELGQQLVVNRNLSYMFTLLKTGSWAVDSSIDNLRYVASTQFPTTPSGPQVHLMTECLLPMLAGFGLPKKSQIKQYLDHKIQHLVEAGLVDYHRMQFAKKLDSWNPKASSGQLVSFSLNSLQGAFYLFVVGLAISLFSLLIEFLCSSCQHRKNREPESEETH